MNAYVPASPPVHIVADVRGARGLIMRAQFDLADLGLDCQTLNDIGDDMSTLIAEWHGRRRPPDPEAWDPRRAWNPCDPSSGMVPGWIEQAAFDWRAERTRRRRR